MKSVGIKQLKAKLSAYVRRVRRGETILVTDRGEAVAELRAVRRRQSPVDDLEEILDQMAAEGMLTRARLPKKGWTWKVKGLGLPAGTAQALLDETRADRWPL